MTMALTWVITKGAKCWLSSFTNFENLFVCYSTHFIINFQGHFRECPWKLIIDLINLPWFLYFLYLNYVTHLSIIVCSTSWTLSTPTGIGRRVCPFILPRTSYTMFFSSNTCFMTSSVTICGQLCWFFGLESSGTNTCRNNTLKTDWKPNISIHSVQ